MNRAQLVESGRVLAWNAAFPIGTLVDYWTFTREGNPSGRAKTRSKSELLGGHTAVVWIEGVASCVALTHVKPVEDAS